MKLLAKKSVILRMLPVGQEGADYKERPILAEPEALDAEVEVSVELRERRAGSDLHGQRLDKALVTLAPEFSRNHLQGLIERGHVRLDGLVAQLASRKVKAGQLISVNLVPTEESRAYVPQAMPLSVLYEDEHLLVLDKPAGLVVHPGPGNWSGTLLNGLLAHHSGAATLPRAGIVHRLDKDTSGVMMVGKTLLAVTSLSRAVAAREVKRRYLALAHGQPLQREFSVDLPVGRDPRVRVRMAVVAAAAGGRAARTDFESLGVKHLTPEGVCAFSCRLHTGRTHQIRVHLQSVGHPLLADELYGGAPALGMKRQALHAVELGLLHPVTAAPLRFSCLPPPDFAQAWAQLDLPPG